MSCALKHNWVTSCHRKESHFFQFIFDLFQRLIQYMFFFGGTEVSEVVVTHTLYAEKCECNV